MYFPQADGQICEVLLSSQQPRSRRSLHRRTGAEGAGDPERSRGSGRVLVIGINGYTGIKEKGALRLRDECTSLPKLVWF